MLLGSIESIFVFWVFNMKDEGEYLEYWVVFVVRRVSEIFECRKYGV